MIIRRKIWSIPIAVLALALMLAGALAVNGIAQAQSVENATFFIEYGETAVGIVTVEDLDGSDTESIDAISTDGDAVTLSGTGSGEFQVSVGTLTSEGTDAETQPITITAVDALTPAGVYSLTLKVEIDLDIGDNTDGDTGDADDADVTRTSRVTIHVIGAPVAPVQFHADPAKSYEGERVSTFGKDVRTDPQSIKITGLGPNSKILVNASAGGADATTGKLSSQDGLDFFLDPNDGSKIIAKVSGETLTPGAINFGIDIDSDVTKDGEDEDGTMDGVKDNDVDIAGVDVRTNLTNVVSVDWLEAGANIDTPPFAFTI